jgi:hypothetical protein
MSNELVSYSEDDAYAAFARVGAVESQGFGKVLKMEKDGSWVAGAEKLPMANAVLLADMVNLLVGWRKWVDGKVEASDVGRVMAGFKARDRHELGDEDETLWPINKLSGKPADPWQEGYTLRLASEDGESFVYNAVSFGGRGAIGRLCEQFARRRANPLVKLTSAAYVHKLYGKTFNPVLEIVSWEDSPKPQIATPTALPPKGKVTITSGKSLPPPIDLSEDIPF